MSDPDRLDDTALLEMLDTGGMLRAVASAAAQVREAVARTLEAGLPELVADGRPRAVVVCGVGAAAAAGDVLAALCAAGGPAPVFVHRGFGLPGWVGAVDLVVAVSCSGSEPEPLSALEQAVHRGCRLVVVGGAGSPLADLGERGRALFVPIPVGRPARASLWACLVPLVVAADALGLLQAPAQTLEATATVLESVAERCRIDADALVNPAKRLALDLDGPLPLVWGTTPLTGAVAARFASQLGENARQPAVVGVLPEAAYHQAAILQPVGPGYVGGDDRPPRDRYVDGSPSFGDGDDFFRDRALDAEPPARPALVLLRDTEEHPAVTRSAEAATRLAHEGGLSVHELSAESGSALERLALLVGLTDYASVYLALLQGTNPGAVDAVALLRPSVGARR